MLANGGWDLIRGLKGQFYDMLHVLCPVPYSRVLGNMRHMNHIRLYSNVRQTNALAHVVMNESFSAGHQSLGCQYR